MMRSVTGEQESAFEQARRQAIQLMEALERGEFSRVYLFSGIDDFQRETILRRALGKLVPADHRETALTVLDGEVVSAQQVASEIESFGFRFDDAERRVVLIRNAPFFTAGKTQDNDLLLQRIESGMAPDVTLVFDVRGKANTQLKLTKAIRNAGVMIEFPALANEHDVESFLKGRLGRARKSMGRTAIGALVARCGLDTQALTHEVDKLIAYVGERQTIELEDVEWMVAPTAELSVFDLVDAVAARQPQAALGQLERLLAQQADPFMLLAMLIRQVRLLLQARYLLDARIIDGRLTRGKPYDFQRALYAKHDGQSQLDHWREQTAGVLPAGGKQGFFDQHYYPMWKALTVARQLDMEALEAAFERLLQTDLGLKSTHLEPRDELELLVVDLCTRMEQGATIDLDTLLE